MWGRFPPAQGKIENRSGAEVRHSVTYLASDKIGRWEPALLSY